MVRKGHRVGTHRSRWISWLCVGLIVVAAPLLLREILALADESRMNLSIEHGAIGEVATLNSAHGALARGFLAQQDERIDQALDLYAGVNVAQESDFREVLRFNLANLYLAQAVTFESDAQKSLMISLVEQAKQNYREILLHNPEHWPSRYNLSRALEMLPDLADVHYGEEVNPERSPQAPRSETVYERLP